MRSPRYFSGGLSLVFVSVSVSACVLFAFLAGWAASYGFDACLVTGAAAAGNAAGTETVVVTLAADEFKFTFSNSAAAASTGSFCLTLLLASHFFKSSSNA